MKNNIIKRFSIIIATYNAAQTLQRCLDSIRLQKNEEVELILVDGDSSDSTLDIIRFNVDIVDYFISEEDRGIYDAWNKGIEASHGEWILFLGADDILCPDAILKYTKVLSDMTDHSIEYISACVNYVDSSDGVFCKLGSPWRWIEFSKSMTVAHVASLHKRSLFNDIGLFDLNYKICADYELLTRKEDQLKTFFLNEIVAHMSMGGISLSERAIKETCRISNAHTNRTFISKLIIVLEKYILYYLFLLRIKIWRLMKYANIYLV